MANPNHINSGVELQKYVLLAKGAKGRAAIQLVETVLDDPNVFVFGEFLECTNIVALASNKDGKRVWDELQTMAFRTYQECPVEVTNMTPYRCRKLKMLSIVSIAADMKIIPYQLLLEQLQLPNVRELEDLVIDCIHRGLFKGRDVTTEGIQEHLSTIRQWSEDTKGLVRVIEERMSMARVQSEAKAGEKAHHDEQVVHRRNAIRTAQEAAEKNPRTREHNYDSVEYHEEERKQRNVRRDVMGRGGRSRQ